MQKTIAPIPEWRARDVMAALAAVADPERALFSAKYFKTGPGQYGEGDQFIGIRVPDLRRVARQYRALSLQEVENLLGSPIHEHRLAALAILVEQSRNASTAVAKQLFHFYLAHTKYINNWDLVDASAPDLAGRYLLDKSPAPLHRLAASNNIWERRISIVATFAFLKEGEVETTYRIAEKLLADKHDLIHKAVGWALRESGKISESALVHFLQSHYSQLPRTTLRYAIERFAPERRAQMLAGVFLQ